MPTFDYTAYDIAGKPVDGVISADSERHARRLLKDKKLLPSKLREVKQEKKDRALKLVLGRELITLIYR